MSEDKQHKAMKCWWDAGGWIVSGNRHKILISAIIVDM